MRLPIGGAGFPEAPLGFIRRAGSGQIHTFLPEENRVLPLPDPDMGEFLIHTAGAGPGPAHLQIHFLLRVGQGGRFSLFRVQCPLGHTIHMPFPVHLHIVKPQCPQAELVINVEVIQNPPVGELTHVGDLNILQFHRKHKPLRGRYPAPKEQQAHQHSNTRALHAGFPLASLPLPGDFFHRRRVVNGNFF
ncbi:DNA-3-methyladenine glycosylase I, partial [Dysosmobacter welbionis]